MHTSDRTEVDDIEYFRCTIFRNAGKYLTVGASGDRSDGSEVCAVVLHEFDTGVLLLPQLDMPIYRRGDEEVRSTRHILSTMSPIFTKWTHLVITQKLMTSLCMKLL